MMAKGTPSLACVCGVPEWKEGQAVAGARDQLQSHVTCASFSGQSSGRGCAICWDEGSPVHT